MKILVITETFLPSTDGVVTRLTNSIRYFLKSGHQVQIIAPDLGVYEFEGAKVIGAKATRLFFYRSKKFAMPTKKIKKMIQEYDPDIIHVVNPALLGASGIHYAKKLGYPLLASYHTQVPKYADYYHLSIFKGLLWWYFRKLHNMADINLCTSQVVHQELIDQGFKNVHVWKRGVDTSMYHPRNYKEAMRKRLTNGQTSKKLLLYVGRLAPEKEIEKIKHVLKASDQFVLAIVGDGPYRDVLERHFQGTNTVFTGFIYKEELASAYASSDVFVFPSTTETLGLVITEAMASGLPIVAAKSGPTCEQIEDGQTGLLYDQHVEGDFTRTVLQFEDETLRKRLAKRAREEIADMGWDTQSKQILDIYQNLTGGKRTSYGEMDKGNEQ
ncbi:Glycosyltransferase involved in cell wall bisynthesis [Gracilibacillus ureilyticus]|uniref:Glycosyltransferase involved in cell wall bisynthesis n=1 Tax=Gracilibacillus ureilyticus TaxID=531814 RepID=A0A1H9QDC4_9BACI|nr:glycosyltransferase family 1 protein [Gracilibacillus ureilyticus]SER57869.1 Glycosyltransferase involved in cell wall bisynthesis [Gracilibacillus ureilyticus]